MYVSTQKERTLKTCYDVLLHNCQQLVVSFEIYISVLLKILYEAWLFKFSLLSLNDFDSYLLNSILQKNPV